MAASDEYEVKILRDDYGVPHVYANDLGALFFGFGRAVAQNRLFQLEMTRRTSWGTVSEVLGPEFVALDTQQRQVGYSRAQVRKQLKGLASEYRTMMRAYAQGINSVIASAGAKEIALPSAFDEAGFQPLPWTEDDVAQLFIAFMGTRYSDGAARVELRDAAWLKEWTDLFGAERARVMFDDFIQEDEDPDQVTTIPREERWREHALPAGDVEVGRQKPPAEVSGAVSGVVPPGIQRAADFMEHAATGQIAGLQRLGVPQKLGSYGWSVGASRTLNGRAILLGGPQMGFHAPGYLHEVGLHGAGFDVVGSTPVGHLPVLFGHNADIAWSATAGYGDAVDVFVEELHPEDPTRYWYMGKWRKLETSEELIHVKGASPVKMTVYRSVHGPIEFLDTENRLAYARSRGFANLELESMAGWIDGTRARTWSAFVTASRRNALSITWLYADRYGSIGTAFCGRYPIRHPRQDRRLPTPGSGDREWTGFVAPQDLPHAINPRRGTIVNWNNLPSAGWHTPGIFIGRAHRSQRIIDFFESRPVITVADVRKSVRFAANVDGSVPFFRQRLLDAVKLSAERNAELNDAANAISAWDGHWRDNDEDGRWDDPGLALFDTWYRQLTLDVFSAERVGSISKILQHKQTGSWFGLPYGANLLLKVLEANEASVPLKGDYLGGRSAEEVMVSALRKAVDELSEKFGESANWRIPYDMTGFDNDNFRGVPQGYVGLPRFRPMRRGSENHIVVLSRHGIRGMNVVPPGQSGIPPAAGKPSPHFADQVGLFFDFDYKPMRFSRSDVEANAKHVEYLSYPPPAHR